MVGLVRETVDVAGLRNSLASEADGAVVVFEGTVRDASRGHRVRFLEYQAYEPMALRQLEEVAGRARQMFAVRDVGVLHRLGTLRPGDCSLAIVVVAAHRAPAFDACRFVIDTIKRVVPIWKKEVYEDGEVWIEGEPDTSDRQ